jgi:putative endonuclease
MYEVYVLLSLKDNGWYIGSSNSTNRRLKEHNSGKVKSTQNRRPLKLIYSESFSNRSRAEKAEQYYKSGAGRIKLRKLLIF